MPTPADTASEQLRFLSGLASSWPVTPLCWFKSLQFNISPLDTAQKVDKNIENMQTLGNLLAISGGHSKSSAFVFSKDFKALAAVEGDRINLHTDGTSVAARNLFNLLTNLADLLGLETSETLVEGCARAVLISAGAASKSEQVAILDQLVEEQFSSTASNRFTVVDDTWAGLLAGTLGYYGTCAFAGTGASVYVGLGSRPVGREGKIDGWGPIIGDFGSGFQLTVDLFRAMGRLANRTSRAPPLFASVQSFVNHLVHREGFPSAPLHSFDAVQPWFDSLVRDNSNVWRIQFARLSKVVTEAAADPKPDPLATALVRLSARQMAKSIQIAVSRWPEAQAHPLVFQGGMFEHSLLYRQIVQRYVAMSFPSIRFPKFKPLMGAATMALTPDKSTPVLQDVQALTHSIHQLPHEQRSLLLRNNYDAEYPAGISGQ